VDNPCAASIGRVRADDITKPFETPEKLVDRLFAHTGALGDSAWANSIRTGKLEHRHMRYPQFFKTGRIELVDDPALDCLSGDTQQGPDEHILSFSFD
jgi:hypothetical protein